MPDEEHNQEIQELKDRVREIEELMSDASN